MAFEICARHNLRYDMTKATGCVLCLRHAQPAAPATAGRLVPNLLGIVLIVVPALFAAAWNRIDDARHPLHVPTYPGLFSERPVTEPGEPSGDDTDLALFQAGTLAGDQRLSAWTLPGGPLNDAAEAMFRDDARRQLGAMKKLTTNSSHRVRLGDTDILRLDAAYDYGLPMVELRALLPAGHRFIVVSLAMKGTLFDRDATQAAAFQQWLASISGLRPYPHGVLIEGALGGVLRTLLGGGLGFVFALLLGLFKKAA